MNNIQTFQVFPSIPERLGFLNTLAMNLWWSWRRDAIELFRRIDQAKWEESGRNPVVFLTRISQDEFDTIANDDSFLAHQEQVRDQFESEVLSPPEASGSLFKAGETIAYFSMEFGIHESLPLFAGGLGILAGDHLKSASDMGLPVTGIGLLYRQGYFRQLLNPEGRQQEAYPETDYYHLPIAKATDSEGKNIRVSVRGPGGDIHADVWRVDVGRVPLYLLDANIHENTPVIRNVTAGLYAGDPKMRLSQEALLGIGGMRALKAMGVYPKVCHMNEGHCAFSALERLSQIVSTHGLDTKTALEIVPRTTIFTTHTPVWAGHDAFSLDLVTPVIEPYTDRLGTDLEQIISWGQTEGPDRKAPLSMFVLGMHLSQFRNGVSGLHGKTARRMWSHVWPKTPLDEIPISHITNGVHIASFISPAFADLFDRYLGPTWHTWPLRPDNIERIENISDEELWKAHELNRAHLISVCRRKLVQQYERQNASTETIEKAESILDDDALTIGFARRFTAYKRADLLFRDPERLEAILNTPDCPIQFIFAGKAHPKDDEGKAIIQRIVQFARRSSVSGRIVFIEDYDMDLARHLVQGVDAWLNTPRRPLEACGTSGMKAAVNGVVNISALDGWWAEGHTEDSGWAIGLGEEYADADYQDVIESRALYNILENDVLPCFYGTKNGNASAAWRTKMKSSIKMALGNFSSHRMVSEYGSRYYNAAARNHDTLLADQAGEARRIAAKVKRYRDLWQQIRIEPPVRERSGAFRISESFAVSATVHLGQLMPEDVQVELYYGPYKQVEELQSGQTETMTVKTALENGSYEYQCVLTCRQAGRFGFTARVIPRGDDRVRSTPGLITWV